MISLAENCDEYDEARAALADRELQLSMCGAWVNIVYFGVQTQDEFLKGYKPSDFRRRPKPDEPTTEPSVLQEQANLIAKLEDVEGAADIGWWGGFGYTPASDRNGIANEAMRHAMTQKPAEPEPKPQAPDGFDVLAPMGRNLRGWGL